MRQISKRIAACVLCAVLAFSMIPMRAVYADSSRIVTLGENISSEGRAKVLQFFGISESELQNMEVITINNQQEHELLDGVIPSDVIGKKTYSCAYIQPTTSGGLNIKTANLTYVTSHSIYNALQTAGIQNGNILVTAPFEVSGTGALTGIFKAYELDGSALNEDKKALAAEELILDSDMEEDYGEKGPELVSDLKEAVVAENGLSSEDIEDLVKEKAEEKNVNLSDEDVQRLTELLDKLNDLDYDTSAFSDKLDDIKSAVDKNSEETKGFFEKIIDFFKSLFGMNSDDSGDEGTSESGASGENTSDNGEADKDTSDTGASDSGTSDSGSIFDDVDTSVFQMDDE